MRMGISIEVLEAQYMTKLVRDDRQEVHPPERVASVNSLKLRVSDPQPELAGICRRGIDKPPMARGGHIKVEVKADGICLSGQAVTVMRGELL